MRLDTGSCLFIHSDSGGGVGGVCVGGGSERSSVFFVRNDSVCVCFCVCVEHGEN